MSRREQVGDKDIWALFDVSWASSAGGLEAYMQRMLQGCSDWFHAAGVSLFLRQDHTGEYLLAATCGVESKVPEGAKLRSGDGIAGACIASGKPMLIEDPMDNPLLAGKVRNRRTDIGSAMVVPLITHDAGCMGVLNVSRALWQQPFTEQDLKKAKSLAGHIALAAGNARLVARLNMAIADAKGLHEKLHAVIANLGVGVVVVSADGEVHEWNPEALTLLGNANAQPYWSDFCSKAPAPLRQVLNEALRMALRGRRADKIAQDSESGKAWSIICSPLPKGGATIAIQDVTALERAERELARLNRLAEIGQMTAAIAHEIRNPLTGIRSAAQMVQALSPDAAEFGSIIEEEALKLNALCDQFLDFARPLALEVLPIRADEVLTQVVKQHQAEAVKAGVTLNLEITDTQPTITGDALRFEQVCRNLILNAVQASKPGARISIWLDRNGLVVEDEGQGMPPELREKLFTPFFTTKANGTGLGLSNVRKIVDAHGWDIAVSSEPGIGTKFEVSFRRRKAA